MEINCAPKSYSKGLYQELQLHPIQNDLDDDEILDFELMIFRFYLGLGVEYMMGFRLRV